MYQVKQHLLKRSGIAAYETRRVAPSPASPRHAIRTVKQRSSDYAVAHSTNRANKARRAAQRHELLSTLDLMLDPDIRERSAPFSDCAIASSTLADFFAEPLHTGISCAIPNGTIQIAETKGAPVDASYIDTVSGAHDLTITKLSPQVTYFIRNSRSPKTRALYRWAWSRTLRVCTELDMCPMPMSIASACSVIVACLNDGLVFGSLKIVASVISAAHKIADQPDPTATVPFRAVIRGIGRTIGDSPLRKEALTVDDLRLIHDAASIHKHPWGTRDWAMIAVGFAGAFRRSELVSRNVDDCEFYDDHLRIWLDRSKTDINGQGTYIIIQPARDAQLCPIAALRAWIDLLPGPGPAFRPISRHGRILPNRLAAQAVSAAVKSYGVVLDLPEDRLGAHSLRAGMITALIDGNTPTQVTMRHSRHLQYETVQKYYRPRGLGPNMTQAAGA